MRTSRRPLLLASAIALWSVACSNTTSGGSNTTTGGSDATTVPSGSERVAGSSAVEDSAVAPTTVAGGTTTSTSASVPVGVSTTLHAGGSATTVPIPPVSGPFATTSDPGPTEPDDMPGPPADDCVDAAAGPATVEIGFDDDRVLYAGETAPSCVRIHAAQKLLLRSSSGGASTVLVGDEVYDIAAGATATTAKLGTRYGVGDVFDLYVEHLDTTVVVQVLP